MSEDVFDDVVEIAVNHMNDKVDENSKPYFAPSYFAPSYFPAGRKIKSPRIPRINHKPTRGLIQQTGHKPGGSVMG